MFDLRRSPATIAGPIAVRLLPRDSYLRSAIEGLFRIGAMALAPEECLGTVLDGRTASDGRDQTVNRVPLARGRSIARVC